ncbi:hypothetical protein PsorP6_006490 [Peronosclerospora sorghi]|uniref:Uncharacterized protein n=1 Tax=Peronosclerospora sorghi TaxID=230839 RepID=A0ACC0W1I6_9STRA|nr:hypothetical protein PsorP6_006490 [Peronosclerospora sorghi]
MNKDSATCKTQEGALIGSASSTTPTPTTPRIKDVVYCKFSGQEVYPGLGAGFEDFILEFEQDIATEALLNQSQ